jgi:hypothetical protein
MFESMVRKLPLEKVVFAGSSSLPFQTEKVMIKLAAVTEHYFERRSMHFRKFGCLFLQVRKLREVTSDEYGRA